jgi:hypothetical protein
MFFIRGFTVYYCITAFLVYRKAVQDGKEDDRKIKFSYDIYTYSTISG